MHAVRERAMLISEEARYPDIANLNLSLLGDLNVEFGEQFISSIATSTPWAIVWVLQDRNSLVFNAEDKTVITA